ncbi:MAG: DUF3784 domain-containing protein [Clostridia bacterium]|nr:DUF3784 domain-containing protein [Clostridia bacterium]
MDFTVGAIITGIVGIILLALGALIWKKKKITLLHDYHYTNVSQADRNIFCTLSGIGIIAIGIGLLLTCAALAITESALSFIAFAVGFAIGISLLIYAGAKYNSPKN